MKIYLNPRYKDFEKLIRRISKEVPDVNVKTMDYKGGKKKPSFVYRDTCYRFEKKGELVSALQELAAYAAKGGFDFRDDLEDQDEGSVYEEDEVSYDDSIPVSPEVTESELIEDILNSDPGPDEGITEVETDRGDLMDGFGYKGEDQLSYDDSIPDSEEKTDTEIIEEAMLEADTDAQEVSSPESTDKGDLLDAFDYKGTEEGYDESVETITEKNERPVEEEALDKAGDVVAAEVAQPDENKGNLLDSYGYSGGDDFITQEVAASPEQPEPIQSGPASEVEVEYSPIPEAKAMSDDEVMEEALSSTGDIPDSGEIIPEEKKGNLLDDFSYMEGVTLSYDDSIPSSVGKPETEVLEEALRQLDDEPRTIEVIEEDKGDLLEDYGYMDQGGGSYADLDPIKMKAEEPSPLDQSEAEPDRGNSFSYVEDNGEEDILVELGYKEKQASHMTEEDDTITLEIPVEKYNLDELKIRIKFGHFGEPGSSYESRKD